MSIFLGSNKGDTITPDHVSSSVFVVGQPKKPSAAADIIFAGGGNDTVAGGGGNDIVSLGAGNDTFIWNGGDGNDIVTGDGGYDTLKFNGANLDEEIEISSLLGAVAIKGSADLGGQKLSSTLVLTSMERLEFATLGGADKINVKGLSGTDVKEVAINLGVNGAGDGAIDRVSTDATGKADTIKIADAGNGVKVTGLPVTVSIAHADANDVLVVNAGAGNDTIDASKLSADRIELQIFAGDGNDKITGSAGSDLIVGGRGDDVAYMGAGDDTFVWNPGEGSDVVEGGEGDFDALDFVGNAANENVDIAANGERVKFFRDVANVTMDLNGVERILFSSLGGADTIHVGNLKGTDVENVTIEMGATRDTLVGDGAKDVVTVDGSADDDQISVEFTGGVADVNLFHTFVDLLGIEAGDQLIVNGGAGNDSIGALNVQAGAPSLVLDGGAGDDSILGSANADTLIGGDGNDIIDGGRGNDTAFLGAGDDRFIWDPGEGSDLVEGGEGFDEMVFNGNGANENFDVAANGERTRFFRDVGNITMDLNDVERATVNALGGADTVTVHAVTGFDVREVEISLAGEPFGTTGDGAVDTIIVEGGEDSTVMSIGGTLDLFSIDSGSAYVGVVGAETQDRVIVKGLGGDDMIIGQPFTTGGIDLTIDGGAGDDFIQGANGVETVFGGDGNDFVDGNQGNDIAFLGAGDDEFQWDPGDGSDSVEGGEGFDTLTFNGANASEPVEISASGERARFFRQPGNITMDLNDVEKITFNALGGADDIVVRDLTGTDVQEVTLSLSGTLLGTTPDGQLDRVTIEATGGEDFIDVFSSAESVAIIGTPAFVSIDRFDATDTLTIKAGAGDDQISASGAVVAMQLTIDGGAGDDTIFGSAGADTFIGGDGDDFIVGNRGNDVADLGAGDDIFIWNPGDGSDTIEGGSGWDFMGFRGANVAENVTITANGERVTFFRDVANITMDMNDVESTTFNAFGGVDTIDIGDLTGTDMQLIELSLIGGSGQANDGLQDSITIAGSAQSDAVSVSTDNLLTRIDGLQAQVQITGADAGLDRLQINTGAGDDAVDASGLKANLFQFGVSLGDGNDAFIGSAGTDVVNGGDGFDILIGGDGDDVLDGGAGLDILTGGAGDDTFANGEIIQDFVAGAGSEDRIDLRALGADFDWVMDHATDTDAGVLFDFNGDQMLLGGIAAASLHQDDFLLA